MGGRWRGGPRSGPDSSAGPIIAAWSRGPEQRRGVEAFRLEAARAALGTSPPDDDEPGADETLID